MKRPLKYSIIAVAMMLIYIVGALTIPPAIHPEAGAVTLPEMATGERIACIDDNVDALIWRIRMIEAAREELILSTFEFGTGTSGQDMMAALMTAAERGVSVKILLDGFNGDETVASDHFRAMATLPNVEVRIYNRLNLLTLWDANFRMHDKFVIVDNEMYMLGGRNTNNLFLGDYSTTPNIDRDILVCDTGADGSLGQVRDYFQSLWNYEGCETYEYSDTEGVEADREGLRRHYEGLKSSYPTAFGFTDWNDATIPANGVSLVCGQIQESGKAPLVWKQLCGYMEQGQNVLIQTPYVICDDEMYADLEGIVSGGTQVDILTNSPETGANPFGCTDLRNQRQNILATGANVLEYAGEHSLHSKTILIDDNISVVGSFNMDMRSAYIDTETMLVIDCPELNAYLRGQMDQMEAQSLRNNADGTVDAGEDYEKQELDFWKSLAYALLGLVGCIIRHLM
ncbi:MAG: phospholipase D family protein [Oscillospiraceae bacterium]|nr:phospholipase D family protein [Oscillospiraceae bacterium]